MKSLEFIIILVIFVFSSQLIAQKTDQSETKGDRMQAKAKFKIVNWEEKPFSEVEGGGKLTRVSVEKSYFGDIKGEGKLEYLMRHREDGSANFYGLERVTGEIGNRSGTFILQHTGTFSKGEMNQESVVLDGSGTGELSGIKGKTTLTSGHQQEYPFTFNYELK